MTASAARNIVRVPLHEREYDIDIGVGNLSDVGAFAAHRAALSHAVVITDEHVHSLHATKVVTSLFFCIGTTTHSGARQDSA